MIARVPQATTPGTAPNLEEGLMRASAIRRLLCIGLLALSDRRGATAVEYGLMVGGIAVAILVGLFAMGGDLSTFFTNVSTTIDNHTPT